MHLSNSFQVISLSETIVVHYLFSLVTYLSDVIKLLLYGYCKSFGTSNMAFHLLKYIPLQVILVKILYQAVRIKAIFKHDRGVCPLDYTD